MSKDCVNTIALLFVVILIVGCRSSTSTTSVSPTNAVVLPTITSMPPSEESSPTEALATRVVENVPVLNAISVNTVDQVECLHTLSGHGDRVIALAFSGDGVHIASSSWDKTIKLWDVRSRQEVHTFLKGRNEAGLNGIAFSTDGSLLASAEAIWDVESK